MSLISQGVLATDLTEILEDTEEWMSLMGGR